MSIKIFFCYAHKDEMLLEKLKMHIKPLQRQGIINVWYDQNINAGTEWEREISQHIELAQIILLLVSPDFVNSDYCYSIEMKRAIERHERNEAQVIPIILRPIDWKETPFSKLQVLPDSGKPVTEWRNRDKALQNVAGGVHKVVNKLLSQRTIAQLIDEGDAYLLDWRSKEALAAYEQALRIDSNNTPLLVKKGHALLQERRKEEALTAYEQAIRLGPKNARLFLYKGEALRALSLYEKALKAYEKAIEIDPNIGVFYMYKGRIIIENERQKIDNTLFFYEEAIRLEPNNASFYMDKGDLLNWLGRKEEALGAYEEAIRLEPNNASFYMDKGDLLYRLGRKEEALVAYEEATQHGLETQILYMAIHRILEQLGRFEEALEARAKAQLGDPPRTKFLDFAERFRYSYYRDNIGVKL